MRNFIDMRNEHNRREIEKILFQELKKDRAKTKALRMSRFCLVEMTRQRMRSSLRRASHDICPVCKGQGVIMNTESQALYVMRRLRWGLNNRNIHRVEATLHPDVASYLQNEKRREIVSLENLFVFRNSLKASGLKI